MRGKKIEIFFFESYEQNEPEKENTANIEPEVS
jgi:hypothetical protein